MRRPIAQLQEQCPNTTDPTKTGRPSGYNRLGEKSGKDTVETEKTLYALLSHLRETKEVFLV